MTTEIEIQVGLKSGMADPEGVNVKKALDLLGFDSVKKVDSVKCYRIIINKNEAEAIKECEEICKKLLANPVVHEYSISVAK
ncbi:MAG: phosphoribosylformylglycinamidine synthase PurS protein [Candidatus Marinimicrobia bacterium]|nr:phosphoribosylformylglycinamidine synthase PurS protein [Candidatus Neomarinimicrobiota bacterium]|tara:strand:- start:1392 stop:1637 length:246 start_codon:yes stop_codon:yes gene_type:complete